MVNLTRLIRKQPKEVNKFKLLIINLYSIESNYNFLSKLSTNEIFGKENIHYKLKVCNLDILINAFLRRK